MCIPHVGVFAGRPERMVHNTFKSMGRVLCVVIKNAYKFNLPSDELVTHVFPRFLSQFSTDFHEI